MAELIAGVDDAGCGPIIGPLVVAGVLLGENRDLPIIDDGRQRFKVAEP